MLMQNAQTISLSHPAKPLRRWSAQDPDQACPSRFESIGVPVSYGRNEEIFGEGEPADYVYQVVSGSARTYKVGLTASPRASVGPRPCGNWNIFLAGSGQWGPVAIQPKGDSKCHRCVCG